jgi:hypothetical protein
MKFTFKLIALLFIVSNYYSYGQLPEYTPLKCKGDIPKDFLELSSAKVKRDKEIIKSEKLSKKEKADQSEFALNSNYAVDQILLSGQVLYGDKLTSYLNNLVDIILKDDPELRKQLRFYTLKSSVPNAFSTSQGIIFVTVGLMAQVENEAQLAFILCHEIIHFTEKHNYQSFKKAKQVRSGKGKYKEMDFEEKLKNLYGYSKSNEMEADKKGFELYSKTNYSSKQAIASFDMLLFSYLPFEEIEWKPNYFEDSFYVFPKELTLDEVQEISADEEEDDKKHTHPNIGKRKSALLEAIDTNDSKSKLFLTKEGDFEDFQHLARIEIAFIYITHAAYERAFYHAFLLEKKYNDRKFANRIKAMALYGTYKHKLADDDFEFGDYKNCEGESQRVYNMFNKINEKDMTVLASREIWNYHLENQDDKFIKTLAYESLSDVFKKAKMNRSYFTKTITKTVKDTKKETEDSNRQQTKIEKLKNKKKKMKVTNTDTSYYSTDYSSLAYITLFKNSAFEKALKELSYFKDEETSDEETEKGKKEKAKKEKKTIKYAAGMDTIVMLNPSYMGPTNKKKGRNFISEEKKEIYLAGIYKTMASKNQVQLSMLNTLDKENLNTNSWNNYMLLNQWLSERLNNDTMSMNLLYKEYVSDLTKDYNTNYLAISGFRYDGGAGYNVKSTGEYGLFAFGKRNVGYYMAIFDIKTSRLEFFEYKEFISKMRPEFLKGIVYNTFYELKNKSK